MNRELLGELREEISVVDREIVSLLARRAFLALRVGEAKGASSIHDPAREAAVLEGVVEVNQGLLSDEAIIRIYAQVVAECRRLQEEVRRHTYQR